MTPEAVFDWAIQTAVAFVATIAFSIIFHTPREQYVCAGLVGAFGWLIYIVYVYLRVTLCSRRFLRRSASPIWRVYSRLRAKRRCPCSSSPEFFPLCPAPVFIIRLSHFHEQ